MGVGAGQRQELADSIRQKHRKDTQRQRMVLSIFVTIGVLMSAASLIWIQLRANPSDATVASPQNATEDYGFAITPDLVSDSVNADANPTEIKIYEDFLCPTCSVFHEESGDFLNEQLAAGNISLTYHPIAFLVNASTDEYSQRASNAAVCVADQAGVLAYASMHSLLMENQPAQGGEGLSDQELITFAEQAGAGDISECVANRTFGPWLEEALKEAKRVDVSATPTIRIDGVNVVKTIDGKESIPGPAELEYVLKENQ
ncbi:DsbA family protein [Gulosibacter chungangensis]|nr:thioredoxin domain-containing protein [Gulosibacter chungangensis]